MAKDYYLVHHGIKGQKWGERRFQEEDGSLTPAGKERYGYGDGHSKREMMDQRYKQTQANRTISSEKRATINSNIVRSSMKEYDKNDPDFKMFYEDSEKSAEAHRLGNTDFYLYTRPDGSKVMFEEDMKWNIPAGMTEDEIIEATKGIKKDWAENNKRLLDLADDVIKGKYGNGEARVKALGKDYDRVQEIVNAKLKVKHSDSYELYHHGILGQKWGIRRFQNEDGTYTAEGKRRRREDKYSEDYRNYKAMRKKDIREMSNKELKEFNNRAQLEADYYRLNPSSIKRGIAIAASIGAGALTLTNMYNNLGNLIKLGKRFFKNG